MRDDSSANDSGPDWLHALFPHSGPPDEFSHRFQRIESAPFEVDGQLGGRAVCSFVYPEMDGSPTAASAVFFLPPALSTPGARVPLLHVAGYELDAQAALEYLRAGIAVSTVHAHALNPLSRGPKLEWALLHAERSLCFIDDRRVFIQGGSAGGYMALMLAAETFPLSCAIAMVPPVNWAYNASYIAKSKALATALGADGKTAQLPVLAAVTAITDQTERRYGIDTESDAFYALSPIVHLDGITAPVLTAFSTADMLVPIDQLGAGHSQQLQQTAFPGGFTQDMDALLAQPAQRVRLLDTLPKQAYRLFRTTAPAQAGRYRADLTIDGDSQELELPFSPSHPWSVVVIDEGPPEPHVGHFKYGIQTRFAAFWRWALAQPSSIEQLSEAKLKRLMDRYRGHSTLSARLHPVDAAPYQGQWLDFPRAERADVLRGLQTFAEDDGGAVHLAQTYALLSEEYKVLGPSLGDGRPAGVRAALHQLSTQDINGR